MEKTVFNSPHYIIKKKEIEIQGKLRDFYVLERNTAVIIIPVEDTSVYFIDQYRYTTETSSLELPAGTVLNDTEDTVSCAQRELLEETGLKGEHAKIIGTFFMAPGISNQKGIVVTIDVTQKGERTPEETELITAVEKKSHEQIKELIRTGKITSSHTLAALSLYLLAQKKS